MYYTEADFHDFYACNRQDDRSLSIVADRVSSLTALPEQQASKEPKAIDFASNQMKPMIGQKFNFNDQNIGDICGLTYDVYGNVVILHRGNHHWDGSTFSWGNEYQGDKNSPISR